MSDTRVAFLARTLLLLAFAGCGRSGGSPFAAFSRAQLDHLLTEGARLVTTNCGECTGGSEDSLLLGIARAESALAHGDPDTTAAYRTLEEGYRTMATVYATADSSEKNDWERRMVDALRVLAERLPGDPVVWSQYGAALPTLAERLVPLRHALALRPDAFDANQLLGFTFAELNQLDSARVYLTRAAAVATDDDRASLGAQIDDELQHLAPDPATEPR
jgi:hypothetical protein